MSFLSKLKGSFSNALRGFFYAVAKERNLQIELFAAFFVILTMLVLEVERWEQVVILLVIFSVIILETLNTMVERLVNLLKPKINSQAGILKDLMAAAVFLAAMMAVVIGLVIFWPYLFG